jgi:hypothetical protein
MALLGYIFILKCNSLYAFAKAGEYLSHKRMHYNYSTKMFTKRAKPIRISGVLLPSGGCQFKSHSTDITNVSQSSKGKHNTTVMCRHTQDATICTGRKLTPGLFM